MKMFSTDVLLTRDRVGDDIHEAERAIGHHEALPEAQLELRKETIAKWGDDRPYYWAAFVMVGR